MENNIPKLIIKEIEDDVYNNIMYDTIEGKINLTYFPSRYNLMSRLNTNISTIATLEKNILSIIKDKLKAHNYEVELNGILNPHLVIKL